MLASPALKDELEDVLQKINKGVKHFEEHQDEAVEYISTKLDYSEEDAPRVAEDGSVRPRCSWS